VPPFHRSLEIDKVLDDVIVAWEMNGQPLSFAHGAPARLVVPGWAGDHWMKWLTRLSPQKEAQTGFYMDVAYRYPITPGAPGTPLKPEEMRPVTELHVKSNITSAPLRVRTGAVAILRGFAYSGAPDIRAVEITADGGLTWAPAMMDTQHESHAWRLWRFAWTAPKPGRFTLHARATDSRGIAQPKENVWNQSGYFNNAWHGVEIEVTA
jgi:DMSO/TMAO reductase YedYZ molybdopterin-dependent catalytic subunit